ncbi:MAG TPA: hypothetical protein VNA04_09065 [Thermoanaerobaculia bacterium]|nr:hypothetical protein [Thermoanaerobaculia bacterium]
MKAVTQDFIELRTRAELLELCDDPGGAAKLRKLSLEIAREVDLTCYGYQLLWRNRVREAVTILEENAARHPESWNAWDSLGDGYAQEGEIARAAECYGHASRLAEDVEQRVRIESSLREMIALGAMAS